MADATVAAPGGQDTSPFGIKSKLNDRVAGRNWTWPLRIACIIVGIGSYITHSFHSNEILLPNSMQLDPIGTF
jgi:hypothetical protein